MAWSEHKLTEAQKEGSKALFKKWKEEHLSDKDNLGQQPWAVFNKAGDCIVHEKYAVCLAGLWSKGFKTKDIQEGAVLFQYPITSSLASDRGGYALINSDVNIIRYLDWVVKSSTCKPWILKHTKKERMEMGVPITLTCPKNIPLLVSTYVRMMWDRHNNKRSPHIFYIKDNFDVSWEEALFIGTALTAVPPKKDGFSIRTYSDCHSPFGDDITVEWAKRFCREGAKPEYFSHIAEFTPMCNRSPGIEDFYGANRDNRDAENFNNWVKTSVGTPEDWGGKKPADGWQKPSYPIKKFDEIINKLIEELRRD